MNRSLSILPATSQKYSSLIEASANDKMIIKDIRIKVFGYCSRNITGLGERERVDTKLGLSLQASVIEMQGHTGEVLLVRQGPSNRRQLRS